MENPRIVISCWNRKSCDILPSALVEVSRNWKCFHFQSLIIYILVNINTHMAEVWCRTSSRIPCIVQELLFQAIMELSEPQDFTRDKATLMGDWSKYWSKRDCLAYVIYQRCCLTLKTYPRINTMILVTYHCRDSFRRMLKVSYGSQMNCRLSCTVVISAWKLGGLVGC